MTIVLTDREWSFVIDALEAQQHGCNPCGDTMMEVSMIIEKINATFKAKAVKESEAK